MNLYSYINFILFIIIYYLQSVISNENVQEIVARIMGGPRVAQRLAEESGYYFKGPVLGFKDTYILMEIESAYPNHHKRNLQKQQRFHEDDKVIWSELQQSKERQKRDFVFDYLQLASAAKNRRLSRKIYKKPLIPKSDQIFNDELWSQEWYLQDTRSRYDLPKLDLNVLPVYKMGITGKGVRISILDDGIEYTHDDLKNNYDPNISYDCNEEDDDPLPRYEPKKFNSHGTRCAGEIAMTANNGKCGVGIAFNSWIGGVKLLDGLVTDRIEGTALSYAQDLVDIYSASWGPNDDGKTVEGPGRLAREAIKQGINKGRNGKGTIYVWASGNGGSKGDNCNCDGYLASPYTISIGSASQRGEFPWYGEVCASTLAVTYSSGAYKDQMITTTDLHNECTIKHTGTSASAPLAAGIIALALEANPFLNWRDIQHLIVWTSEVAPLKNNPGWQVNGAGLWFSTKFGFGLMNAQGFVGAALNWTEVPRKSICSIPAPNLSNQTVSYRNSRIIEIYSNGCECSDNEVNYLEHVELQVTISYTIRGALEVYLTSPLGSKVELLGKRNLDQSMHGFNNWTFMSVMTWGEMAAGRWLLEVLDETGPEDNFGLVSDVTLRLHGTKQLPEHMKHGMRVYNHLYNLNNFEESTTSELSDLVSHNNLFFSNYFK